MKKIVSVVLLMLAISVFHPSFAQTEQEQRIQSSYILAFNKKATPDELNFWKTQGNLSVAQLLAKHKEWIKKTPSLWDGILRTSYTDAFGRTIQDGEYKFHIQYPRTYLEMMNSHMDYLNKNPSLYDNVIIESYKRVFGKPPITAELNYWKGQTKCSFIWLFRAHSQYASTQRRNVASMTGVAYVRVTPAMLAEVRSAAAGMVAAGGGNLIGNDGGTMVAAGAGNLVGIDGASMVAAGGGN